MGLTAKACLDVAVGNNSLLRMASFCWPTGPLDTYHVRKVELNLDRSELPAPL
jgi:hypothetical protein